MSTGAVWEPILESGRASHIEELVEFLRIPSVSTDPASAGEVLRAAEWVAARLQRAGIENIEILPTGPHACVYGDWLHATGKPTVLMYGHFDVQPPDPLELWTSPPFEPVIKDGCIFARGASDMKANLLLTIIAAEAMLAAESRLPVNIKFLFEGQEEIGSPDLGPFISANRERLACDFVLTPDGGQWGLDQPCIGVGGKGLCALQVDLETASMDLHSGLYGGAVPNAAHALVALLGSLRDADDRILVEGFYDQVTPLTSEDRAAFAEVPFDDDAYRVGIGVDALVGEPGYSTYERAWARPTIEINGLESGYQGDGVKTVIPARAQAKLTCRLVAGQEPDDVLAAVEQHLICHTPPGARLKLTRQQGRARAYLMPRDDPYLKIVAEVLEEVYGKVPFYVRSGGTLPILDMFLRDLNAYTGVLGFGLDDERIHSPNEFFRLRNFDRGKLIYARVLERLGGVE